MHFHWARVTPWSGSEVKAENFHDSDGIRTHDLSTRIPKHYELYQGKQDFVHKDRWQQQSWDTAVEMRIFSR